METCGACGACVECTGLLDVVAVSRVAGCMWMRALCGGCAIVRRGSLGMCGLVLLCMLSIAASVYTDILPFFLSSCRLALNTCALGHWHQHEAVMLSPDDWSKYHAGIIEPHLIVIPLVPLRRI